MKLFLKSLKPILVCCCAYFFFVGQTTTPSTRFENKKDGTVVDNRTGLIWQRCPAGLGSENSTTRKSTCGADNGNVNGSSSIYNWGDALRYCKGALTRKPPVLPAGKSWRLPNIKELKTIVDRSQMNPAMDTNVLIIGTEDYFWSSTTVVSNPSSAWTVSFFYGTSYGTSDKDFGYYVRCVSQ
ncbi:DUF1566 domain-containing protein [Leptospira yasudae]|uniref:DUF1566 domain-containing protein n=1 Tax=Leptospira yasudae TaxID=2202201 RepID=A0A6N4QXG6_9LEPT|nr:DUF1566 domain-containing protein [Leptospira yasudae]TGL79175.1 DUF1566 domain-containing protein [Leptospira yasudae]TGL83077.1 DUF1566 domain-containing protein [Leptospira yasudae]TGL85692.1 DUF1566 domain-containing protein [Leptospira yasudae]